MGYTEILSYTLIIPVFNESGRIFHTISGLRESYLSRINEVLFVDDGSTDDTARIIRDHGFKCLILGKHKGKGAALKAGILAANNNRLVLCDCDSVRNLEDLLSKDDDLFDIVIGSRWVPGSRVIGFPLIRFCFSRGLNFIIRNLFGVEWKDTQSGLKILSRSVALTIIEFCRNEKFFFDTEIVLNAHKKGCAIKELPINWFYSKRSRVFLPRDSLSFGFDIIKYVLQNSSFH